MANSKKKEQEYIEKVRKDGLYLKQIEKNQTYHICLEAVKEEFETLEICLEAVKNNGYSYREIRRLTQNNQVNHFQSIYNIHQYLFKKQQEIIQKDK